MSTQAGRPKLLVVFYANPDDYPPTFNAVSLLAEHFDVRIVCRKTERESRLWSQGVRLDRVGRSRSAEEVAGATRRDKVLEFVAFTRAVHDSLRRERPSVVLAYEPHAYAAVCLAGVTVPVVYQRHEVEELDALDWRSFGGWVSRYALRLSSRAARLVFPEAARAAYYERFVDLPRRPLVIPNFPLISSFPRPDFDALLPHRAQNRLVLYRGAVGPANGIREAIEAVPWFDTQVNLRISGPATPSFAGELDELVSRLRIEARVQRTGFVPFDELNRQTQLASVGLMLYQAVGTNWTNIASANNKVYEYAASGVPAVVPDRAGFRELLGSEEWVACTDERSPAAIAAAVRFLLEDPVSYHRRARAARRRFEERFNYQAVFGPMLEEMVALAGRRVGRGTSP